MSTAAESIFMRDFYDQVLREEHLHKFVVPPAANPFASDGVEIIGMSAQSLSIPQIKVLPARAMLEHGKRSGILEKTKRIVEGSSGNTAAAFGLLASLYGYSPEDIVIFGPRDMAPGKHELLNIIGVDFRRVGKDETPAQAAYRLGQESGYWNPNQYGNIVNANAHYNLTGPMILSGVGHAVRVFSVGIGSGGTLIGVSRFLKEHCPDVIMIGAMCNATAEIPGVRDLRRMQEITLPWKRVSDITLELTTRPSYLGSLILKRYAQRLVGPSGGMDFVALLRSLKSLKDSGAFEAMPRDGRGKIVAGFLVPDTSHLYNDRFTAHLPGSIVESINPIPWDLVYRDDW